MTSFAITTTGGPPNVSSPFKTSSLSPTSTVDSNAEDAKTELLAHVPPPPCSSMADPSTASTCTLQLYKPIADTKEIVYDSSKARERHTEQDSSALENATCTAGSKSRDTNVTPSEDSTTGSNKANLLFLALHFLGGCLLRPRRHGNKSAKEAVAPRRGIRGRLQLLTSRSSSSDGSDPTTATTLINGEQNRLLSDGSGDSAEGFRTLPATHTDELLEGSVSEVCDESFYANEDDNTLDDVSYAFSQAAGIPEEEPRGYDDIGIGIIWDEIGTDSEGRLMSQADTDADTDGTDGGDAIISLLFDDEDETDGGLFTLSDANEDGEKESNGENEEEEEEEEDDDDDDDEPDELEYVQPSFTHKSLRQASEKQTSYDFIIDDNEEDDELCADGKHM